MYYKNRPLHFECTGCGKCCTGSKDYYVAVTPVEQRRIQESLGISRAWFRRHYLFRADDGVESLRMPGGRCILLGDDNRCRVYSVRPAQCRHYPFWPELVGRETAWRLERRRCEGIGRGTAVPIAEIERRLRKQESSG
jgi:uncharacterized protein